MLKYISTSPFVLVDENGKVIDEFQTLGIIYDVVSVGDEDFAVLIKHGNYYDLCCYFNTLNKIALDELNKMKLVRIDNCLLDDLNFILTHSALPEAMFDKLSCILVH